MLQRQVDVPADLLALGHRVQHVVGDRGGVEVEQPDPLEAVDRVQLPQQPREGAALAPVDAVERRVLRDQQQLPHAPVRERPRLAHDRLGRAAAVRAAQRRDDAERAGVVAALGDLDVREVRRRRQQARGVGVVEIGRDVGIRDPGLVGIRSGSRGVRLRKVRGPEQSQRDRAPKLGPGSRIPHPEPRSAIPIASRIRGTSPVPSTASISGISCRSSSR